MATTAFKDAERKQLSMLASLEKKTLIWLAHRLPAWVNSDHLTLLGFVAMFVAGLSYWAASYDRRALLLVIAALIVNWFGDSLDGTVARVRNRLRPRYGFYVDHVIDTFSALFVMGGLALSGYTHPAVAMGMLVGYLMLSAEAYLASYTLKRFRLSYAKLGPTELRILLGVGSVVLLFRPVIHILGRPYLLFDVGGVIAMAGMAGMLVVSAICHTVQLYREERVQ